MTNITKRLKISWKDKKSPFMLSLITIYDIKGHYLTFVENIGVEPVTFPHFLRDALVTELIPTKKAHIALNLFKAVENIGVEPVTFPHFLRDALVTELILTKKAHIAVNLFKALENIGVEPTTFPHFLRDALVTELIPTKKAHIAVNLFKAVDLTSKKSNQIWNLLERIYTLKAILIKRQSS